MTGVTLATDAAWRDRQRHGGLSAAVGDSLGPRAAALGAIALVVVAALLGGAEH